MWPTDPQRLPEAYRDAIQSEKRGYLFISNLPDTPDDERLMTHIFPDDPALVIYKPLK